MANDALDFGPSNTTRHFTMTGPELGTAGAEWCVGFWMKDTRITGSDYDYGVGRNTLGANNSFQIFIGQSGTANPGQVGVRALGSSGTEFNQNTGTILSGSGNDFLIVAQKRSTNMEIYVVQEGTSVGSPTLSSGTDVPNTISSGTWYLGARSDLSSARFWQNPFGEFFVLTGDSLTAAQVTTLAAGQHINAVKSTRAVDLRFRGNNATELDQSGNGRDATRVGTGYTLVNEFFPNTSAKALRNKLQALGVGA